MNLTRRSLLATSAIVMATPAWSQTTTIYRDRRAPIADRVRDLLGRMTLEEKAAQLCCIWFRKDKILDLKTGEYSPEKAAKVMPDGIGQIGRPSDTAGLARYAITAFREPEETVTFMNAAQRHAVEGTRLGIPLIFHEETAHGLAVKGATSFPVPPALGSTWDPELIERIFTYTARQARTRGVTVALSPVLDLVRDPRWGRNEEFFGEDPHLVGEMGLAAVRGLQGPTRPVGPDRLFATLKHFIHGAPQNGINVGPSDMSERMLRETYLPPFAKAIRKGKAAIVMPSYNEVGGVPAHANRHLLQEVGRELLGFEGLYLSDYGGIDELVGLHKMGDGPEDAAALAMHAGVDVDLPDSVAYKTLPALVRSGRVPVASVDAAVARVLSLKFEAGLFEQPYVDVRRAAKVLTDPAGAALARTAAQKALVLLKNDGILPLDPSRKMTLAVIGPNAKEAVLGGYSGLPEHAVGVLEGITAAAGGAMRVEHADGVWITQPDARGQRLPTRPAKSVPPADNAARIKEAAALAARSDVVLLVVGDNEQVTRETISAAAPGDRDTLNLYGDQDALVEAVLATGKPVVALLLNGRPLAVNTLADKANALVEGWYLGEQGGNAVADMIFGKISPGGKMAVSIPRSVGDLPSFYNRHPSSDKSPYVEGKRRPLYPFGHGLSYTTFVLAAPRLNATEIDRNGRFRVDVDVTNSGSRAGDEVVQVYIRDMVSSVPRPTLELKAFRRVTLKPGERRTVSFDLGPDELAFWDADMKWTVEPGAFRIYSGNSSASLDYATLTVR
ncbi:glycoside hydrolase family 3 N-terminal domain-containing protein [Sphingomonas melonis]|uniref:beta-glucosidase n=1 Tax=Sphingomonas melonis TaxID=152682 RepID=A0A7Y9JZU8_9SPHN|nr:glycoside hydrolase family 3 N-terminal domain-containing protein [Sphingomonas melonis]NYD89148.1 beta-glucosidase [Sphingomonas melonis]